MRGDGIERQFDGALRSIGPAYHAKRMRGLRCYALRTIILLHPAV